MRMAVCDDEEFFSSKMIDYIENKFKSLDLLVEKFESGEDLVLHYKRQKPYFDVLLLDIEMPGIDGMQTANIIRQFDSDSIIIFVTSHGELACAGYEVSAFRFLTKPVDSEKLMEALSAARQCMSNQKKIVIQNSEGEFSVKTNDILYIEAQNQQIVFYTEDRQYIQRSSMAEYERKLLENGFYLIHRSYLINMQHIKHFSKQEVVLEGNIKLPLSRLRYKEFETTFHNYLSTTAF